MRIEHPRTHTTPATEPASGDTTRSAGSASSGGAASGRGDRVSLSAGLRLVKAALEEAKAVDAGIRPEAVARGKALVASGELDTDLAALAERLLPDLIDSHDDDPT
jgi:hypothetical protein